MRYFSPAILDGSVTTAKLADLAVTTAKLAPFAVVTDKLSSATVFQAGSIPLRSKVTIALSGYDFFPDIEADMSGAGGVDVTMLARFRAVPNALVGQPDFDLFNESAGSAHDYDVAWRRLLG